MATQRCRRICLPGMKFAGMMPPARLGVTWFAHPGASCPERWRNDLVCRTNVPKTPYHVPKTPWPCVKIC